MHLIDGLASAGASVDFGWQNLATTFVNAIERLMIVSSETSTCGSTGSWLFKNKEHGKASAAGSLGMILMWDVDSGLTQINKYFQSNDNYVIVSALLGAGIVNCSIRNDYHPVRLSMVYVSVMLKIDCQISLGILYDFFLQALTLPSDHIGKEDTTVRIGAIMGLGLTYTGSEDEQVREKLSPTLADRNALLDVIAFTAISLGLIYLGSCNEDVNDAIVFALIKLSELELDNPLSRLLPFGLGLLYLGKKGIEFMLSISWGNVLNILTGGICCSRESGISVGQFLWLLDSSAFPTQRLSHDTDLEVAMAAIISLGLIGAGTNNDRIARMLRNLSRYYYKAVGLLFCVRIAQSLVHLGKGLLTFALYHSNRLLCLDKSTVLCFLS
ncbi:hypothetical protein NE237_024716 [Protea cynaroides]|uniref:26S proteasome non-ATPase regulatory subunit 2 n=1 Tax=Protea cynaroides TaxID=273540 RepID=A0A9Q0K0P1_9MAGN|nr:hypothetical protein NE237_024716 [Protea cynaroides]